jgi:hypothetical protein
MIILSGRLEPDDYLKAIYLHHRPPQYLRIALPLVIMGYLLAVLFYGTRTFSVLEVTVLIFPLIIVGIWRCAFLHDQARAQFYQDVSLSYPYEFTMTFEHLRMISKLENFQLVWSEFLAYKVSPRLTILYRSENEFYVFPSRWFESSADVCFFRDRLQEVLGAPQG